MTSIQYLYTNVPGIEAQIFHHISVSDTTNHSVTILVQHTFMRLCFVYAWNYKCKRNFQVLVKCLYIDVVSFHSSNCFPKIPLIV